MSEIRPDRVAIVQDLWRELLPVLVPNEFQLRIWLASHDLGTVCYAVRETAIKYQRTGGRMDASYALKFASKCMNTKSRGVGKAA